LKEIEDLKEAALKDANAFDKNDKEDNYTDFEYFLLGKIKEKTVATAAYRKPKGDVAKNLNLKEKTAELKNMHIHPNHQRKGYGTKLLEKIENKARKENFSKIALRTTNIQEKAHKFYQSNGYTEIKRIDPDYKNINYNLVFFNKKLKTL